MKRIYLCGPMSGLPDNNYPAFRAKAAELRAQGYHVEDPSENQLPPDTQPGREWETFMKMSIRQMLTCESIFLMQGWEKSRGATIEARMAKEFRMVPIEFSDRSKYGSWNLSDIGYVWGAIHDAGYCGIPVEMVFRRGCGFDFIGTVLSDKAINAVLKELHESSSIEFFVDGDGEKRCRTIGRGAKLQVSK